MDYSYFAPPAQPYPFFGIAHAKPDLSYTPREEPQNEPIVSIKHQAAHPPTRILEPWTNCLSLLGWLRPKQLPFLRE